MIVVLVFVVFMASAIRDHPPFEALLFAIALAVGLAPEMLPAVLATMLSQGARRMAMRGVLIRRLEAIILPGLPAGANLGFVSLPGRLWIAVG